MQERSSKVIAIVALCVGVVGLSLGFAAFTANLQVESGATYTPDADEQFVQVFGFDTDPSSGTVAVKYDKLWTGISAEFDGVNQNRTFTATVLNGSNYNATLVAQPTIEVDTCTGADGTTEALVTAACNEIRQQITDGNTKVEAPATVAKNNGTADGTGTVTVTIHGPSTAVDGVLNVTFKPVAINYTTGA